MRRNLFPTSASECPRDVVDRGEKGEVAILFVVEGGHKALPRIDKGGCEDAHDRDDAVGYARRIQPSPSPLGVFVGALLGFLE